MLIWAPHESQEMDHPRVRRGHILRNTAPLLAGPEGAPALDPEFVSLNEDLLIELLISAWHPNMLIEDVRLIVDWEHSDALKGKVRLPPLTLYTGKRQPSWSFWTINRFTWPRRRTMKLTVPIKELAEKEVLQAGLLRGAVFVEVNTPQMWSTVATWLGRLGRTRTLHTPLRSSFGRQGGLRRI